MSTTSNANMIQQRTGTQQQVSNLASCPVTANSLIQYFDMDAENTTPVWALLSPCNPLDVCLCG